MLITVFAGVFGLKGIISIFVSIHTYLLYGLFFIPGGMNREQLVLFVLACELPLAVSYMIWHTKNAHENDKDKAFDALARELNQVANKSEIVINAIADGVLAIDARGTIQLINPAAQTILGWTKQDAIGLDYHSVLKLVTQTAKELTPETDPIQQVIHSGQSLVNNDLSLATQAGKQVLLSLLISPIGNTLGSGVITVFRDITAEKAEERQQAEFISTASHEMRTPVAAMEGYIGLALNPA
ncbi:MAG: PAS domain-containing protein, partial [Microcoleus sp.]